MTHHSIEITKQVLAYAPVFHDVYFALWYLFLLYLRNFKNMFVFNQQYEHMNKISSIRLNKIRKWNVEVLNVQKSW